MKHTYEVPTDVCDGCGELFCKSCLVWAYGPAKPPFCVPCALAEGGVRKAGGSRKRPSQRDLRKRRDTLRAALAARAVKPASTLAEAMSSDAFDTDGTVASDVEAAGTSERFEAPERQIDWV